MKNLKFLFSALLILSLQFGYSQTLQEAIKFLENENYGQAINVLTSLTTKEPTNPLNFYYLGETKYTMEDYTGAEKAYQDGLKANSKSAENNIGLAKLMLDQGKAAAAQTLLDGVTKNNKKNAAVFGLIGRTFLKSKTPNAKKALEYLGLSRDMDPKPATTWSDLGDAYNLMNDLGNAMSNYELAVEKDKNNLSALMSMAKIWASAGQINLAVKKLEDAISLSPDYAPAYKSLYELYIRTRAFDKVTPLLSKYVSLVGSDVDAKVRLVKFLCFEAKDYDRAISEGVKVAATNPEQYTLYRWLAWAYYEKDNFLESYNSSKKLFEGIDKDPANRKRFPSDNEYYAKATYKLGKLEEAETAYELVLVDEPKKANDYYGNLAKSYFDGKNYEKALVYYNKKNAAKSLNATDTYYVGLAQFYTNKFVEADSSFAKVLSTNPNYPQGWWMRVRIARSQDTTTVNRAWLAKPMYEKFIEYAATAFTTDPDKNKSYKNNLVESYNYLAYHAVQNNDNESAIMYYTKYLDLKPDDKDIQDNLRILKQQSPGKN